MAKEALKHPTKLAICGKVINTEKVADKTLAQFKQQLKQNGVEVSDERAEKVYKRIGGGKNRSTK